MIDRNFETPKKNPREIFPREEFFQQISDGSKTSELRIAFPSFRRIEIGDEVNFKSAKSGGLVEAVIIDVRVYADLEEVLTNEDLSKLAPSMTEEEIRKKAPAIFSEDDIKKHGFILFEFENLKKQEEKNELPDPGAEAIIKERLYRTITEMYEYVMFSGCEKYLGYASGVGFAVEGINFSEPPLQKLLSLLHLRKEGASAEEYIMLVKKSCNALRDFDYTKEVSAECQNEFLDLGSMKVINTVAHEFKKALEETKK